MAIKGLLCSTLLLIAFKGKAQQSITATAQLEKATIYSRGVTLEHNAQINIPLGQSEIIINNIANELDERSIQIAVPSAVNILSVRFDNSTLGSQANNPNEADFLSLKSAESQWQSLSNRETAERNTLNLIEDYGKSLSNGFKDIKIEDLDKLATYYKKQQIALRDTLTAIAIQKEKISATIQALKIKTGLIAKSSKGTGRIILKLMATQQINSNLSFSYFSKNAAWTPSYDFKVKHTNLLLNIVYKADVVQTTGLDWIKARLSLSTGNPILGNNAPELHTQFLRFANTYDYNIKPVTSIGAALDGAAPGLLTTSEGGQPGNNPDIMLRGQGTFSSSTPPVIVLDGAPYSGALNSINPLDIKDIVVLKDATAKAVYGARAANGVIVITTRKQKNTGISDFTKQEDQLAFSTYDISIPYDILSDGNVQTLAFNDTEHDAKYHYLVIPKLDTDAFLMAALGNFESLNLQNGMANIIYDNNYLGQTQVSPYAAIDTFYLSLGRDKKIVTKRNTIEDKTSTKLIGNSKKRTFTYEIVVKNTKKEPVNITVKENVPIATDNSIVVELLEHSQAQYDEEKGILDWKLQLQAGESKTIRVSYSVKYPSNKWIPNL